MSLWNDKYRNVFKILLLDVCFIRIEVGVYLYDAIVIFLLCIGVHNKLSPFNLEHKIERLPIELNDLYPIFGVPASKYQPTKCNIGHHAGRNK